MNVISNESNLKMCTFHFILLSNRSKMLFNGIRQALFNISSI